MSSLKGEDESSQSELVDGMVPALNSEDSSPRLRLVTAENMTVEFIVDVPEQNKKCQVGRFMQQTNLVFSTCTYLLSSRLRSTK